MRGTSEAFPASGQVTYDTWKETRRWIGLDPPDGGQWEARYVIFRRQKYRLKRRRRQASAYCN